MKIKTVKRFYFILCMFCLTIVSAQEVSISVLSIPSVVTQGSTIGRVSINICNNNSVSPNVAAHKLRPLVTLPSTLIGATLVPISNPGWSILSNTGNTIHFENTDIIIPGGCSEIIIGYTGVNIGGPLTAGGTLGFNGAQTTDNVSGNDNSTTSITVVGCNVSVPTVVSTTQPSCGTPTGTIVFSTQTGVQYGLNGNYQSSPVFAGLSPGVYNLSVKNLIDNTCETHAASNVTISAFPNTPLAPTGNASQNFCPGETIGLLNVTGSNVKWYLNATGGTALPSTTSLVSGTTYYASQTVGGCESTRKAVIATLGTCLKNDEFELDGFNLYPNPTSNIFNIEYSKNIDSVKITDLLGKVLFEKKYKSNSVRIDLSNYATATYLVKVKVGGNEKIIKVVKQ